MEKNYEDILYFNHYVSKKRQPMSRLNRAAQFAPFAALTGHEDAIVETARQTDEKIVLDESQIEIINQQLQLIHENLPHELPIVLTYFQADSQKKGGSTISLSTCIKKIDVLQQTVVLYDKTKINIEDIISIEIQ